MRVELRWPLADTALHPAGAPRAVVVDTNIVLDLLVFADPATTALRQLLRAGDLRWVATQPMRDELERVLDYPQIAPRVAFYGLTVDSVLQHVDAQVQWACVPPRALAICRDADDQKFIDLAVAERALLLSKDKAVIALRKRLHAYGAHVGSALVAAPAA